MSATFENLVMEFPPVRDTGRRTTQMGDARAIRLARSSSKSPGSATAIAPKGRKTNVCFPPIAEIKSQSQILGAEQEAQSFQERAIHRLVGEPLLFDATISPQARDKARES